MAQHGTRKNTVRTAQAVGAVLAGVMLSSCGQAAGDEGDSRPPIQENAPAPPAEGAQQEKAPPAEQATGGGVAESSSTDTAAQTEAAAEPDQAPPEVTSNRCHTSMLSGEVRPGSPGAGQRYADLVLTNTSGQTCDLYGYGGLELVDAAGASLPTDLTRVPDPEPTLITLAPGESASKALHWTAVPGKGEPTDRPCQPEPSGVRVIPPDETDPLSVDWGLGSVCGFGSIDGGAYQG